MNPPLTLALLLLNALPARADSPWYDTAIKDWDETVRPAESLAWLGFIDENGNERTLYHLRNALKTDSSGVDRVEKEVPLYALDPAPRVEKRMMHVETKYQNGYEDREIELAIFDKNKISAYYLPVQTTEKTFELLIKRRDRPETNLRAWKRSWWPNHCDLFSDEDNLNGRFINGRVQILKPEGLEPAASSPLTAAAGYDRCWKIPDLWERPSSQPSGVLYRGWLPQEMEFWQAPLDGPVSTSEIWNTLEEEAEKQIKAGGTQEKAAQYHDWFREVAGKTVDAVIAAAPGGPVERLTPQESRFVHCRMRRLGKEAEAEYFKRAAGAGDGTEFTRYWRMFVVAELKAYKEEVKPGVPRLPRLPDHKTSNDALLKRTREAFAGSTPGAAPPPTGQTEDQKKDQAERVSEGSKRIQDRIK